MSIAFELSNGETKSFNFKLPFTEYKGFWTKGEPNQAGDLITHGGNIYHANQLTVEPPTENHQSWTLAVRKGRDGRHGRDGKDGEKGERGLTGPRGRDLTQLGFNGEKH